MKNIRQLKITIAFVFIVISVYAVGINVNSCFAGDFLQTDQKEVVKKACLEATIKAIKMEIRGGTKAGSICL